MDKDSTRLVVVLHTVGSFVVDIDVVRNLPGQYLSPCGDDDVI